jgi:hypothetical protein
MAAMELMYPFITIDSNNKNSPTSSLLPIQDYRLRKTKTERLTSVKLAVVSTQSSRQASWSNSAFDLVLVHLSTEYTSKLPSGKNAFPGDVQTRFDSKCRFRWACRTYWYIQPAHCDFLDLARDMGRLPSNKSEVKYPKLRCGMTTSSGTSISCILLSIVPIDSLIRYIGFSSSYSLQPTLLHAY